MLMLTRPQKRLLFEWSGAEVVAMTSRIVVDRTDSFRVCAMGDGTAPSTEEEVKDRGGTLGRFHTKRASAAARKAGRQAPPAGAVGAATSGDPRALCRAVSSGRPFPSPLPSIGDGGRND
jgi:hypothetical protein